MIGKEVREGNRKSCITTTPEFAKLQIGSKEFLFDKVFDTESSQEEIFDVCAHNLVLGCFAGYNATILAYGQTGSGKTHTMGTGSTVGLSQE
jgi:kinesin family protein 4/21/27